MATQQAAAPAVQTGSAYWRAAGMTYIKFATLCAVVVRKCQKEPFKTQSLTREKVHYKYAPYADGVQQKSGEFLLLISTNISTLLALCALTLITSNKSIFIISFYENIHFSDLRLTSRLSVLNLNAKSRKSK